jgi:Ca2+-binding RTX toxin-like protein
MSLSNIIISSSFDFGFATEGDDRFFYDELPATQIDTLRNSVGIEAIVLQLGNDFAQDNDGSRIYFGNKGNDTIFGNAGSDTIASGQDDDLVQGGDDRDFLFGNLGSDTAYGGNGNDLLFGGQNNDFLLGEGGNDLVSGDLGDDSLSGGVGADTLTGGEGNDLFFIQKDSGADVVTDFQNGIDTMQLPENIAFEDLLIQNTSFGSEVNTSIIFSSTGETLILLKNVLNSTIDRTDFGLSPPPPPDIEGPQIVIIGQNPPGVAPPPKPAPLFPFPPILTPKP